MMSSWAFRQLADFVLYKAERAGVVRVVGKRSWQGRTVNLYDLSGDWR